jgi:hypothetical protein
LIGLGLIQISASAVGLVSDTRSIHVGGPPTTRTTPGAFVNTMSNGDTSSSTGSSQDTSISLFATLIKIDGSGDTTAQHTTAFTTSQKHTAESYLDTNFSLLNNSPYVLSGILTIDDPVPLGGSPQFDNSTVSVLLAEVGGPTLFSFSANGSYRKAGTLTGGKSYHLHIESELSLQTREIFNKVNGWSIDFIASDVAVPEPGAVALAVVAVLGACHIRRRPR